MQIPPDIYQEIASCLPLKTSNLTLDGSTTVEGVSYFSISYPLDRQGLQSTYIALDQIGCRIIVPENSELLGSLTLHGVSPEVACSLKADIFGRTIERFGRQRFESVIFLPDEDGGLPPSLLTEEACALKRMGFEIPSNVRVINSFEELQS